MTRVGNGAAKITPPTPPALEIDRSQAIVLCLLSRRYEQEIIRTFAVVDIGPSIERLSELLEDRGFDVGDIRNGRLLHTVCQAVRRAESAEIVSRTQDGYMLDPGFSRRTWEATKNVLDENELLILEETFEAVPEIAVF